jgi:hypothetical protein
MILGLIILVSILVIGLVYKLTVGSIEHLGTSISSFYPFDVKVKRTGAWSTIFYLLIVVGLFSLIVIFSRQGLTKLPGLPA